MRNIIEVNGIKLYAFHGCLDEEGMIGGNYVVDVMLNTDFSEAAQHDTLHQTVDYVDVNKIVSEETTRPSLSRCGISTPTISTLLARQYQRS